MKKIIIVAAVAGGLTLVAVRARKQLVTRFQDILDDAIADDNS